MQVLTRERLWAAKRWMSWRNYYEYLGGTLWWLEGIGTIFAFLIPVVVLASGARTSTAAPLVFAVAFISMFTIRLWGIKRLFRKHIHWPTAFALRIFRVPVGISCLWWLVSRNTLQFQVTPKPGADERVRGRAPSVLWLLIAVIAAILLYAVAGLIGWVPWHATPAATVASGVWLTFAGIVLLLGTRRIGAEAFATSRRNAYRVPVRATVSINGVDGELVDVSVGGAAVRFPTGSLSGVGVVELLLPGAAPIRMETVPLAQPHGNTEVASLRVIAGDWSAYHAMSLWLFHTPPGVIEGLPPLRARGRRDDSPRGSRLPVLERQHG